MRIALANKKTAIVIAAATFVIAAIWYAFEISRFSSLSEADARSWLKFSEHTLIGSSILLAFGLVGEWSDSETWKKRSLYKAAKLAVIIGVVGELLGDGEIFAAGDRLQQLTDKAVSAANTTAADAHERAATLEKEAADIRERAAKTEIDAANLKKENIELERALTPRTIALDQYALALEIKDLPRIPIFITAADNEEARETAGSLMIALNGFEFGNTPTWTVNRKGSPRSPHHTHTKPCCQRIASM